MPEQKKDYKRKTVFIKKNFQFTFILRFCLILLAGVLISTFLLFTFSQETLTSSFENSRLVIKSTGTAILPAVVVTNLITMAIISIAAVIVILYISHRIAGPMYRFEKDLKQISTGDLGVRINLRKKDQFADMAHALNLMTDSIQFKVLKINQTIDEWLSEGSEPPDGCPECRRRLEALKKIVEKEFSL